MAATAAAHGQSRTATPTNGTFAQFASAEGKRLGEEISISVEFEGKKRDAFLFIPNADPGGRELPLVFNYHGFGSNAGSQRTYSGMSTLAETEGFLVIYPNGWGDLESHNGGACCPPANEIPNDDVGLAKALIEKVDSIAKVDRKRVYSVGMSNGGFMSIRLGCEASDVFAAVASVTGVLGNDAPSPSTFKCEHPGRSVPYLHLHGTSDDSVPYEGDPTAGFKSAPETVREMSEANGCFEAPRPGYEFGAVKCETRCGGEANTTFCTVAGGKHSWWGSPLCPIFFGGEGCFDIDSTGQAWDFFKRYTLPAPRSYEFSEDQ